MPRAGPRDLTWLADLTGSLDGICGFLLRVEITAAVRGERLTALPSEQMQQVVNGRVIQIGSPMVHIRDNSTIVELAALVVNGTILVQVLAWLALLFKNGPEIAGWPDHIKASWYAACSESEQARLSYQRTRERSIVEVIEDFERSGKEADVPEPELPPGVRHAPPLMDS
ncbi:MAG: hypothetical protein ACRDSR_07985 [Pseudonocardiaceae bacterium]